MPVKKILIVSVSAGAGHVSPAQAVFECAQKNFPELEVQHIDMMDYVSTATRRAIVDMYEQVARNLPNVWRYIYEKTNDQKRLQQISKIIKQVNRLQAKEFYEFIDEYKPDHIICTHSFPAQVIRHSKEKHIADLPISLIVTDYGFHSYWIMPNISNYFVSSKKMSWEMQQQGIQQEHICISGIPLRKAFLDKKPVRSLKEKYHIDRDEKVILVLAGGQGMMQSDIIVRLLQQYGSWKYPIRIIAISGKNKKLYKALLALSRNKQQHMLIDVVEWTVDIDEYIRVADVVVSKPGGSTTTECLALGVPMVAIRPIPGQEESNAAYILEKQAGYVARTDDELVYYVQQIFSEPLKLERIAHNPAEYILKKVIEEK